MDPNNGQSESGTDVMAKLEEDLQKLNNERDVVVATNQPIDAQLVSEVGTPPQETQVPVEVAESIVETATPPEVAPDPTIPPENKKGSPMLIISLGLVVVALLAAIAYVVGMKFFSGSPKQIACTAEARVCDDGTSVGRSGPNCEFEACPVVLATPEATPDPTANWKSYSDKEYSFKLPTNWDTYLGISEGKSNQIFVAPSERIVQLKKLWESGSGFGGGSFLNMSIQMDNSIKNYTPKNDEYQNVAVKDVIVSGINSKLYTTEVLQSSPMGEVGDKLYSVHIFYMNNNYNIQLFDGQYKTEFDQILSTFKFVETTPSGSPTSTPSSLPVY